MICRTKPATKRSRLGLRWLPQHYGTALNTLNERYSKMLRPGGLHIHPGLCTFLHGRCSTHKVHQGFFQTRNYRVNAAHRSGDKLAYSKTWMDLRNHIQHAKNRYRQRIKDDFSGNNPPEMWRGIRTITEYKDSN